jgi:hypothetical protein
MGTLGIYSQHARASATCRVRTTLPRDPRSRWPTRAVGRSLGCRRGARETRRGSRRAHRVSLCLVRPIWNLRNYVSGLAVKEAARWIAAEDRWLCTWADGADFRAHADLVAHARPQRSASGASSAAMSVSASRITRRADSSGSLSARGFTANARGLKSPKLGAVGVRVNESAVALHDDQGAAVSAANPTLAKGHRRAPLNAGIATPRCSALCLNTVARLRVAASGRLVPPRRRAPRLRVPGRCSAPRAESSGCRRPAP